MTRPTVSIVMPTYNRLHFLRPAVESIFLQTMSDWELIVADDGSDDDVLAYLGAFGSRVRVLRLPHSGNPGRARNAAIAAARAPLVAFMDSDDLWAPSKLARQLAAMRGRPECRWSYCAFILVDAQGAPLRSERDRPWTAYEGDVFAEVVRGLASIRTPAVLASVDLLEEAGAFDESIDCAEDYDLWMRLALRSPVCVLDEPLVYVRRHREEEPSKAGRAHVARDYSLRKLAGLADAAQRALLARERSRNALAQAVALAKHRRRWRAVAAVAKSLPFSWKYPSWWYGGARAIARACVGPRRHGRAPT